MRLFDQAHEYNKTRLLSCFLALLLACLALQMFFDSNRLLDVVLLSSLADSQIFFAIQKV